MKNDIVIRIPAHVLRELLADHDRGTAIQPPQNDQPGDPRPWSNKQRVFIYRLLLRLGHEGEAAKRHIAATLRLNGEPPTRRQASGLIDRLQDELAAKEAGRGAA